MVGATTSDASRTVSEMGQVLWHTPMSLDGFIAGPDDDMEWVFGIDTGSGRTTGEVVRSIGALLVGRRTQDVEDRLHPGFYGGAFRGPFFVLRHDPPDQPPVVKGVTGQFLDMDIEQAVTIVKRAANGGNVVVLGANVARQCLEAGLLDEIIVHVAPVLVGAGVRFFQRAGGAPIRLRAISSHVEGETTVLRYAVPKPPAD
jgi:dihydrofolate reductase